MTMHLETEEEEMRVAETEMQWPKLLLPQADDEAEEG